MKKKGCFLEYREGMRVMFFQPGDASIMDVDRINDVLISSVYDGNSTEGFRGFGSPKERNYYNREG